MPITSASMSEQNSHSSTDAVSSERSVDAPTVDSAHAANPDLGPLEGGRWRPVSPDELLRKNSPDPNESESQKEKRVAVRLERRQELEHKLKSNPTDLEGFLELAAIYRSEERPLEAKRLLKQAQQIFPDNDEIRFQHEEAVLARSLQQLREVTDLAKRLNNVEADRELVRSQHDWACRRIDVCKARLLRDPSQLPLHLSLAEAKFDAEFFEESYTEAGKLLKHDEFSPQAHFIRARCLLAMNKDLPAMKELRAVSLRRAVVAPVKLRVLSLKMLCELADKLALEETGKHYQAQLHAIEASLKN